MEFESHFRKHADKINERLNQLIPAFHSPYQTLFHAAKYSLNTPGKRLRPILTLVTTEILGGERDAALTPACALEMVHTYSLIHDDLPCMDDDDFRRGLPTLHKVYPEAIAVLAGDFLLTHAFQVLCQTSLPDNQKLELISLLSERSGGEGLIAGQVMDLESENMEVSFETLKLIHLKKTGALISAAVEFGAIIANASADVRIAMRNFGYHLGLAFQIVDDILDVTHPKVKHGKNIGSDESNRKFTSTSHLGTDNAYVMAKQLVDQGHKELERFPVDVTPLKKITEYAISRKR